MQDSSDKTSQVHKKKKVAVSSRSIDLHQNTEYDASELLEDIRNILHTSYLPDYEETKLTEPDIAIPFRMNISAVLTVTVSYSSLSACRRYFEQIPDEIFRVLKNKFQEFFSKKTTATSTLVLRIELKDIKRVIDLQMDATYITVLDKILIRELNILGGDLQARVVISAFKNKPRFVFKCVNDDFHFVNAYSY